MSSLSTNPRKCERTDTLQSSSAFTEAGLRRSIDKLSPDFMRSTLLAIALQQNNVARTINTESHKKRNRRKPAIDFKSSRMKIYKALNPDYRRSSKSRYRYPAELISMIDDASLWCMLREVEANILQTIASIVTRALQRNVGFSTKRNALETLLHIGEDVCESGCAVSEDFNLSGSRQWLLGMKRIIKSMKPAQRREWGRAGGAGWARNIEDLDMEGLFSSFGLEDMFDLLGLDVTGRCLRDGSEDDKGRDADENDGDEDEKPIRWVLMTT